MPLNRNLVLGLSGALALVATGAAFPARWTAEFKETVEFRPAQGKAAVSRSRLRYAYREGATRREDLGPGRATMVSHGGKSFSYQSSGRGLILSRTPASAGGFAGPWDDLAVFREARNLPALAALEGYRLDGGGEWAGRNRSGWRAAYRAAADPEIAREARLAHPSGWPRTEARVLSWTTAGGVKVPEVVETVQTNEDGSMLTNKSRLVSFVPEAAESLFVEPELPVGSKVKDDVTGEIYEIGPGGMHYNRGRVKGVARSSPNVLLTSGAVGAGLLALLLALKIFFDVRRGRQSS